MRLPHFSMFTDIKMALGQQNSGHYEFFVIDAPYGSFIFGRK